MATVDVTILAPVLGTNGRPVGAETKVMRLDAASPVQALMPGILRELGLDRPDAVLRTHDCRALEAYETLATFNRNLLVVHLPASKRTGWLGKWGRQSAQHDTGVEHDLVGVRVLPCYLVIDVSTSMGTEQGATRPLDDINSELPRLYTKMQTETMLARTAQLGLITFDARAVVKRSLQDVMKIEPEANELKALVAKTNYGAAFVKLRETISRDLYALFDAGRRPYRPAVFFLSDGQPNLGEWQPAFESLTSRDFFGSPNVVAFGFGTASNDIIGAIGTTAAYIKDETPSAKLDEFLKFLLVSMMLSIKAERAVKSDEDDIFRVPAKPPPGWRPLHRMESQ